MVCVVCFNVILRFECFLFFTGDMDKPNSAFNWFLEALYPILHGCFLDGATMLSRDLYAILFVSFQCQFQHFSFLSWCVPDYSLYK